MKLNLQKIITYDITYDYYAADFGEKLGIYPDGHIAIGQSVGKEIDEDEQPAIVIDCPGFDNLDIEGVSNLDELREAVDLDADFRDSLIEKLELQIEEKSPKYAAWEEKAGNLVLIRPQDAKQLPFSEYLYLGDIGLDEVKDLPSLEKTSENEYRVLIDDFQNRW